MQSAGIKTLFSLAWPENYNPSSNLDVRTNFIVEKPLKKMKKNKSGLDYLREYLRSICVINSIPGVCKEDETVWYGTQYHLKLIGSEDESFVERFPEIKEVLTKCLEEGPTYLHCKLGASKSPCFAALLAVDALKTFGSINDALTYIQKCRGRNLNDRYHSKLLTYESTYISHTRARRAAVTAVSTPLPAVSGETRFNALVQLAESTAVIEKPSPSHPFLLKLPARQGVTWVEKPAKHFEASDWSKQAGTGWTFQNKEFQCSDEDIEAERDHAMANLKIENPTIQFRDETFILSREYKVAHLHSKAVAEKQKATQFLLLFAEYIEGNKNHLETNFKVQTIVPLEVFFPRLNDNPWHTRASGAVGCPMLKPRHIRQAVRRSLNDEDDTGSLALLPGVGFLPVGASDFTHYMIGDIVSFCESPTPPIDQKPQFELIIGVIFANRDARSERCWYQVDGEPQQDAQPMILTVSVEMVPRLHESKNVNILNFKDEDFLLRLFSGSAGFRLHDLVDTTSFLTWHMVWHGEQSQQEAALFATTVYNYISSNEDGMKGLSRFMWLSFFNAAENQLDDQGWEGEIVEVETFSDPKANQPSSAPGSKPSSTKRSVVGESSQAPSTKKPKTSGSGGAFVPDSTVGSLKRTSSTAPDGVSANKRPKTSGSGSVAVFQPVVNEPSESVAGSGAAGHSDPTAELQERVTVLEDRLTSSIHDAIVEQALRQVYGHLQTNTSYLIQSFEARLETYAKKSVESASREIKALSNGLIPKVVATLKEKIVKIKENIEVQPPKVDIKPPETVDNFSLAALDQLTDHFGEMVREKMDECLTRLGLPLDRDAVSEPLGLAVSSISEPVIQSLAHRVLKVINEHFQEVKDRADGSSSAAVAVASINDSVVQSLASSVTTAVTDRLGEVKSKNDGSSSAAVTVASINDSVVQSLASSVTTAVTDSLSEVKSKNDGSSSAAVMVTEISESVVTKVTENVIREIQGANNTIVQVGQLLIESSEANVSAATTEAQKLRDAQATSEATMIRLEKKLEALATQQDNMSILLKSAISQTQMMSALLASAAGGGLIGGASSSTPTEVNIHRDTSLSDVAAAKTAADSKVPGTPHSSNAQTTEVSSSTPAERAAQSRKDQLQKLLKK